MLRPSKRRVGGFSLVELMVVVAVLAIIATIGYPMYTQQVLKGRRVDARAGLTEIAMALEREFAAWGQYSELPASINTDGTVDITFNDGAPAADANSRLVADLNRIAREYGTFYTFDITATASAYTVTATPIGIQAEDAGCAGFGVDQTGTKTATDLDLCW